MEAFPFKALFMCLNYSVKNGNGVSYGLNEPCPVYVSYTPAYLTLPLVKGRLKGDFPYSIPLGVPQGPFL
jgi:hypothetical protein